MRSGEYPELFKRELITPIPKVNKPKNANDYRSVAVTDILSRICEKVILNTYID